VIFFERLVPNIGGLGSTGMTGVRQEKQICLNMVGEKPTRKADLKKRGLGCLYEMQKTVAFRLNGLISTVFGEDIRPIKFRRLIKAVKWE
jgi:hypothetical protein